MRRGWPNAGSVPGSSAGLSSRSRESPAVTADSHLMMLDPNVFATASVEVRRRHRRPGGPARRATGGWKGGVSARSVNRSGPCAERFPPGAVIAVPGDRGLEGLAEVALRLPAERLDLGRVDGVAPVVTEAVLHVVDHGLVVAGHLEDRVGEEAVRDLVARADVVDLADASRSQHDVDGLSLIHI